MFFRFLSIALLTTALCAAPATLRICADPNNLPFSDRKLNGFENRIAEIIARDLNAHVEYFWWPQRRGFARNTLRSGECDVIVGLPSGSDVAQTTRPYYRSTYVFLTRKDSGVHIGSLDDPVLRKLKIGVQLVGDDYANTPPAHALSSRGIVRNIVGYRIAGDYALDSPPSVIVQAVIRKEVDVAIVWGPLAGYYARRSPALLELIPVRPEMEGALPFVFDISMGIRKEDAELKAKLERALDRHQNEIRKVLRAFGVPLVEHTVRTAENP